MANHTNCMDWKAQTPMPIGGLSYCMAPLAYLTGKFIRKQFVTVSDAPWYHKDFLSTSLLLSIDPKDPLCCGFTISTARVRETLKSYIH